MRPLLNYVNANLIISILEKEKYGILTLASSSCREYGDEWLKAAYYKTRNMGTWNSGTLAEHLEYHEIAEQRNNKAIPRNTT